MHSDGSFTKSYTYVVSVTSAVATVESVGASTAWAAESPNGASVRRKAQVIGAIRDMGLSSHAN